MKTLYYILISSVLIGCSATQIPYTKETIKNSESAYKIIEQVIYEQPTKYRPEELFLTDTYIGYSNGSVNRSSSYTSTVEISPNSSLSTGLSKSTSKNIKTRIYFNSLNPPKLYKKRSWYVIQLRNRPGHLLKNVYTRDKNKAIKFINALLLLIDKNK